MVNNNLKTLVNNIISAKNYNLEFVIYNDKKFPNESSASYSVYDNRLILRLKPLVNHYFSFKSEYGYISFRDFLNVIIVHEFGHCSDEQLPFLQKRKEQVLSSIYQCTTVSEVNDYIVKLAEIIFKAEKNAWQFAHGEVPKHLLRFCDNLENECYNRLITFLSDFREKLLTKIA